MSSQIPFKMPKTPQKSVFSRHKATSHEKNRGKERYLGKNSRFARVFGSDYLELLG